MPVILRTGNILPSWYCTCYEAHPERWDTHFSENCSRRYRKFITESFGLDCPHHHLTENGVLYLFSHELIHMCAPLQNQYPFDWVGFGCIWTMQFKKVWSRILFVLQILTIPLKSIHYCYPCIFQEKCKQQFRYSRSSRGNSNSLLKWRTGCSSVPWWQQRKLESKTYVIV